MSIWKRIKNLWKLSGFEFNNLVEAESDIKLFSQGSFFAKGKAQVVDMRDPLSVDLGENDDK